MKRIIFSLLIVFLFGMCPKANAFLTLSIGDGYYVGSIDNGIPACETHEVEYINYLITLFPGSPDTILPGPSEGETYNRENSCLDVFFQEAVLEGAADKIENSNVFTGNGFWYILGKYATSSIVWYIEGGIDETIILPGTFLGNSLSHISAYYACEPGYKYPPNPVPESATVLLLALGLFGFALMHKKAV